MNRRRLLIGLTALTVLYIVIREGFVLWASFEGRRNDWLVEKEADPAAAPLPNVVEDDWVAIIAHAEFASKTLAERVAIADQRFHKIRDLASGQGFDLKDLQKWYQHTAENFERYPIQIFVFAQGVKTNYRDLRNSGFPKPTVWSVFARDFFSKDAMLLALFGLPFVAILILLVSGVLLAIFSKRLTLRWRLLVVALVLIISGEAWFLKNAGKHPVSLGIYQFYDHGTYISVNGTWTSDTKIAAPLQVTQLDCWRQQNQCIEATAQIFNGQLRVDTSYWEIKNWGDREITFVDHDSSLCKVETLRVDRKSRIVTSTNAPKRPMPDSCRGLGSESKVFHLVDGYKIEYK